MNAGKAARGGGGDGSSIAAQGGHTPWAPEPLLAPTSSRDGPDSRTLGVGLVELTVFTRVRLRRGGFRLWGGRGCGARRRLHLKGHPFGTRNGGQGAGHVF